MSPTSRDEPSSQILEPPLNDTISVSATAAVLSVVFPELAGSLLVFFSLFVLAAL